MEGFSRRDDRHDKTGALLLWLKGQTNMIINMDLRVLINFHENPPPSPHPQEDTHRVSKSFYTFTKPNRSTSRLARIKAPSPRGALKLMGRFV